MAVTTATAILAAAAIGAGTAEEQRKSGSKAASKARRAMMVNESPVALPETGGDPMDSLRRRKKTTGRASTMKTGSLVPENVGYKTLLG
jgi:hypothetical protein